MARVLALFAAALLVQLYASTAVTGESLDVTSYFSFTANSTCGNTPTISDQLASGVPAEIFSCFFGEHNASFALDSDLGTWWQSENGESPVQMTFVLENAELYLSTAAIRLHFRGSLPRYLRVETRSRSSNEFTLHVVYAADGSCDQTTAPGLPCSNISSTIEDTGVLNVTTVLIPLIFGSLPIAEIQIIGEGYQQDLPPESQYYALAEATIFTNIAPGYFTRSLHYIAAQGESGLLTETGVPVQVASNELDFPGFTSRGYAVFNFDNTQRVSVQYMFPSLPKGSRYRLVFRYAKLGQSRRFLVMITQGSRIYSSRVTLTGNCNPPCYATLTDSANSSQTAEFDFDEGPVVIQMSLSSVNFFLDSIIAIPQEFYMPELSNFPDADQFLQECDATTSGTLSTQFCIQAAQQLSIRFYGATYACACQSPGSAMDVCEAYGGQCSCFVPTADVGSFTGRQCDLCPFYTYVTPQGCAACDCLNELDMCEMATGQCSSCPQLVVGRTCDRCADNSFGDPNTGCEPCVCDMSGTESCDQVTGDCQCKVGVTGLSCDRCMEGSFNFLSSGCAPCGCDAMGSESVGCDINGQCSCKSGIGGLKCSECLPGFFSLSENGCTLCNCSGRTSTCTVDPLTSGDTVSAPQELCTCPLPYIGASCEGCVDGFYTSETTGDCEMCDCNERATLCAAGRGDCINCADNSTGSNCELCSDGFYDNDPGSDLVCSPCPCDSITSVNTSCMMDTSGNPVCYCLPGHVGSLCDTCAEGYFGSPPDFRCTSCDCNGNIDPDIPMSCDRDTGVCLLCINSTGDECQFCEVGSFGDATLQDCQPCDCFEDGSDNSLCNNTTGQCSCLEGVGGQSCDQCQPGYWNFTSGVGCELCACGDGSASLVCDEVTGRCPCNPGVGGDECSICLDGFYGFSPQGCTECGCGIGSVNTSCTPEGRCYCQPGVMGDKCDLCQPFHSDLSSTGCQPCGECEQMIRARLEGASMQLTATELELELFADLYTADINGSSRINDSLLDLEFNVTSARNLLDAVETRLNALESETIQVDGRQNLTLVEIDSLLNRVDSLLLSAEDVHEHIQIVYNTMQNVLIDIGLISSIIQPLNLSAIEKAVVAQSIEANITSVSMEHDADYSEELTRARASLGDAIRVRDDAMTALTNAQLQLSQAVNITRKYNAIGVQTEGNISVINDLEGIRDDVRERVEAASASANQLARDVDAVENSVRFSNMTFENAETAINELQYALMWISNQIEELTLLLGEEAGSDVISGSGSGSGFGIEPIEPETLLPETPPTTVIEGVALLRAAVTALGSEVDSCEMVLQRAESHVINLQQEAEEINNILTPSLTAGDNAVAAISDYASTISIIEEALNIALNINTTIQQLQTTISNLMADSFEEQANDLLENSRMYMSESSRFSENVANLSLAVSRVVSQVYSDMNETDRISFKVMALRHLVNALQIAAEMFSSSVLMTLDAIDVRLNTVHDDHVFLSTTVSELLVNVDDSLTSVTETQNLNSEATGLLVSTNASLLATRAYVRQSSILSDFITAQNVENEGLLDGVETRVNDITNQLALARTAAASIDVALRFYGNSSLSYSVPTQTSTSSNFTSISLIFRPSLVDYGTLLYTVATGGMESSGMGDSEMEMGKGVSLRLYNGSVQFEYDPYDPSGMGVLNTEEGVLEEEEWYHLFATRDVNSAFLTVSPLQGSAPTYSTMGIATPPDLTTPPLTDNSLIVLGGADIQDEMGPLLRPNSDGFVGCIDRVVVNNAQLSLLLPNEIIPSVATCGPRPPAEIPRMFESGAWLQGAGSFLLLNAPSTSIDIEFGTELTFSFRTLSQDGTILYITDANLVSYITVFLLEGLVVLEYSQTGLESTRIQTTSTYSDGLWYSVSIIIDQQGVVLTVNGTEMVTGEAPTFMSGTFNSSNMFFIGGVSPQVEAVLNTSRASLPGCVRDVSIDDELLNLEDGAELYRVVLGGCPAQVSAGVRFMGDGYAQFEVSSSAVENVANISLDFRTTQLAALLLRVDSEPQIFVSLFHTRIRVDIGPSSYFISVARNLNDNRWHSMSITIGSENISLTVDGEEDSEAVLLIPPTLISMTSLLVGGTPYPQSAVIAESLRGCIRDIRINERVLDFNTAQSLEGVSLFGCRPPSLSIPVPPPPPPLPPPPSTRPNVTVGLEGNDGTFIAVPLEPMDILLAYSIVLEFQTSSSDALLLYTEDVVPVFADYMALELRGGRLYYSYNLGSGRVFIVSNLTYNDGEIHRVELRRVAQFGEMIIDEGLEYQSGISPSRFTALNINSGLLYVGGIPLQILSNLSLLWPGDQEPKSALACFHSLSINSLYEDLSAPYAMSGAVSCLEAYNNVATFNSDSYLQILDSFNAGTRFSFSLRFRTTYCSGVLIYVHSLLFPDHVVVELFNGTVRFVFDNGPLETVVEYTPINPLELCDNQWHSLLVEKVGVQGTVTVDDENPVTVSSPHTSFSAVNTNDPLYIGGVPASVSPRYTSLGGTFRGCIGDVYISQGDSEPKGLLLAQAVEGNNVDFHTCSI